MSSSAADLWIVHRDERLRAALRRLAGAGDEALLGGPDDAAFRDARPPRVVLLGVAGDFEAELEFAHRLAERLPAARWLLLVEPLDRIDAERLFDALPAEWLEYPPTGVELRRRIHGAARRRRQDELSQRRLRDALSARFARTFGDLELEDVLRAVDPRLASVPLLVRGEPGTGRALLARYVHAFGGAGGSFVELDCRALPDVAALRVALADAASGAALGEPGGVTICLREVDALPAAVQYALRGFVELGPPGPLARARRVRWVATAGDDVAGLRAPGLAPELAEALAGLSQRVPPLRERGPAAIARFAEETAAAWCRAHGERPRRLAPEALALLEDDPWPGNHRELEAVLARTLAAEGADPIRPEHLRFDEGGLRTAPAEDAFAARVARSAEDARATSGPREPRPASERAEAADAPPPGRPAWLATDAGAAPREAAAGAAGPGGPAAGARAEPEAAGALGPGALGSLSQSLAHELRNRLVAIRTFAALLPERAEDRSFREEFSQVVGADVRRMERALDRLAAYAALPSPGAREPVDVAELLDQELEALRGEIEGRRLLVLKELDRSQPAVLADRAALAFAFEALLARAFEWMPDRGDLYLASKAVAASRDGGAAVRVVLRFHRPGERRAAPGAAGPRDRELSLELVLAELALRGAGGRLRVEATDAEETVIAVDLPGA